MTENERMTEMQTESTADSPTAIIADHPQEVIMVQVAPPQIDVFNKIIEAYDNLALVTTLDADRGRLALWVTPDTAPTVLKLITKLPLKVELLSAPDDADDLGNRPERSV